MHLRLNVDIDILRFLCGQVLKFVVLESKEYIVTQIK